MGEKESKINVQMRQGFVVGRIFDFALDLKHVEIIAHVRFFDI